MVYGAKPESLKSLNLLTRNPVFQGGGWIEHPIPLEFEVNVVTPLMTAVPQV